MGMVCCYFDDLMVRPPHPNPLQEGEGLNPQAGISGSALLHPGNRAFNLVPTLLRGNPYLDMHSHAGAWERVANHHSGLSTCERRQDAMIY